MCAKNSLGNSNNSYKSNFHEYFFPQSMACDALTKNCESHSENFSKPFCFAQIFPHSKSVTNKPPLNQQTPFEPTIP